jgi:hypothetical protein
MLRYLYADGKFKDIYTGHLFRKVAYTSYMTYPWFVEYMDYTWTCYDITDYIVTCISDWDGVRIGNWIY